VLPSPLRMRRGAEFTSTVRRGSRGTSGAVTVHLALDGAGARPQVGFIVGRTVGPAVVRNRVRRRLRHLLHAHLAELPIGASVVVRAHPEAATRTSAVLGADLGQALRRAQRAPATRGPQSRARA
jgi:ribonuclease P protein component